ncbi:DUF4432 family protein [Paenibacillus sp. MMS20-IR301]|uniref:DUF4432 family protein n=1 Tax=Paenibacillus sp. MMS20-IR301 TaxID=2895946 RepID=UPI0028E2C315|nr:DUF4432 family protein [Paenibacillus sp. MMS20-IR301]WNS43123.1 DUF4432 family protein [Paenibacillus sp. MMS20-IR301]
MTMHEWALTGNQDQIINLPNGGCLKRSSTQDHPGAAMTIIELSNGRLMFTVLIERGLDIGVLYLGEQKMSWERSGSYLLHPSDVDLQEADGTGWMKGFYGAVAAIGPECFGTPGEGFTLHGSGSYSAALPESIQVFWDDQSVRIEGIVPVKDRSGRLLFEKWIRMSTVWGGTLLCREERVRNCSSQVQVLDDGYHIQLSGAYMEQGGRYVLPAERQALLLRDSAPAEENPLHIPARAEGPYPMRCYQYVPGKVAGLARYPGLAPYVSTMNLSRGLTAEMIVDTAGTCAGYVIRPLADFPRSLIAKQIDSSFMFAIEPCRSRPNRMSQKITDGEALFIEAGETLSSSCIIGLTDSSEEIRGMERLILAGIDP